MSFDIGTDVWNIDGYHVTPTMRQEIMLHLIGMYKSYDYSYEWQKNSETGWSGLCITDDPNPVTTVDDYLGELNGERWWGDRSLFVSYWDVFEKWLQEYLADEWTEGVFPENDDGDDYWNAIDNGISRIAEMISKKTWEDVLAWERTLGDSVSRNSMQSQR